MLLIAFIIGIPVALIIRAQNEAMEEEGERREAEAAAMIAEEKKRGAGVYAALRSAYVDLKRQGGAGYGPWLSCCIERQLRSGDVPAAVALMAVRKTRGELSGSRFKLDALDAAISKLEEETGEGE